MEQTLHSNGDKKEISQRANAWYDQNISCEVEEAHRGEFLVVDVDTGDYEIDKVAVAAMKRARARHPEGVLFLFRVGYDAAYSIGGQIQQRQRNIK